MIQTYSHMRSRLLKGVVSGGTVIGAWLAEPSIECAVSAWVSLVMYESLWNRMWAWGIMITLLCHELGHMVAARLVGVRTSMPIFIPFVGAVISLRSRIRRGRSDVAIALGGPALGGVVSIMFLIWYCWSQDRTYLVWAYLGAEFNLLNLLPCYPLDGERIVQAVSAYAWCVGMILMIVCLWIWREPILILFIVGAIWRYYRQTVCETCLPIGKKMWVWGCYLSLIFLLAWLDMMIRGILTS